MKRVILIVSILLTTFLNAFSLKDKIVKGNPGDYVVTEQMGTYTILVIRTLSAYPSSLRRNRCAQAQPRACARLLERMDFYEAPGHTAWISYLIHLEKNKLLETIPIQDLPGSMPMILTISSPSDDALIRTNS